MLLLLAALVWAGTLRPPPTGFVDLSTLPHVAVQPGYATAENFTGAPLPGYGAPGAWLREEPAASLAEIAAKLHAEGYGLLVYDAYRPARASAAMVAWTRATHHEDWVTQGYIAARSRHNQGIALDLTLTRDGVPLDMGTPWDHFGPESHTSHASGQVLQNRRRLAEAMVAGGWAPYTREWWHFTWAAKGETAIDVPYAQEEP